MNADRLFALYDRVADAPDAVGRLRRFVLDLGVRGKLVEQDPVDGPASELLNRIATEKARLVKAGKIRNPKPVTPVDELPFEVPWTWRWTRLGLIASYIQRGKSPKYAVGEGSPVVSQKCIQWTDLDLSVAKQITLNSLKKYDRIRFLRDGDLLWNSTGTGTIGRVIRLELPPDKLVCDSHVTVVRCLQVDSEYVRTWLRTDHVYGLIEERAAGATNQVELTARMANEQLVPLPPLAEQRRIVAKVDELLALCDQLEAARTAREDTRDRLTKASLARLSAPGTDVSTFRSHARFAVDALPALTDRADQIKHLRQTILNLAVRGKLVGHDPADEPALELLKRIAIAKSELKQKTGDSRIRPAHNPNRKDYPVSLPGSWEVQSFENLFLFVDYRGKTPPKTDAGVPLITAKNVRFGSLNREPREFIGQESFKAWMTRGFPQIGDLLFTTEAPMANICLNNIREPFALAQRVICLQPYGDICTRYFMFATMSNLTQTSIKDHSTGLTAKGIKAAKLKPIPIPIPPLVEQHRIVAKVDELMALCDRIEAGLAASDVTRSRLLESLLHDAFRTFSAS